MAAPETKTEPPIRDGEKNAATEQQIDPWDVQAAHDEHGNVLALDYVAISQYA
jgi:tryptophanyl-tRNA synthetase